ncbi:MAG: VWA domain-containing protein, partial [Elusimicrobiota bacterium]|nr:VWA domain-containing protein [Elusimicrobiota bacterium]
AAAAAWRAWAAPGPSLPHPGTGRAPASPSARALAARSAPPLLTGLALALVALSLARPQRVQRAVGGAGRGIDIVLALDSSISMNATDLEPTRLEVAKQTAARFVRGRAEDRIGLVTFGGAPLLATPLTVDYDALIERIGGLEGGMTKAEGTAVGDGLVSALRRLRESSAKSKVVVLLTDGRSNAGAVDPLTAAKAAAGMGVKVYTIGTATRGPSEMTVDDPRFGRVTVPVGDDLDEETLAEVARLTGGRYWRAETALALRKVYDEIDRLEKSAVKLPDLVVRDELYPWPTLAAALLLLLEAALGATVLLRWP